MDLHRGKIMRCQQDDWNESETTKSFGIYICNTLQPSLVTQHFVPNALQGFTPIPIAILPGLFGIPGKLIGGFENNSTNPIGLKISQTSFGIEEIGYGHFLSSALGLMARSQPIITSYAQTLSSCKIPSISLSRIIYRLLERAKIVMALIIWFSG